MTDFKKQLGMSYEDLVDLFINQLKAEGFEMMIALKGEKSLRAAINNSLGAVWMHIEATFEDAENEQDATVGELAEFAKKHGLRFQAEIGGHILVVRAADNRALGSIHSTTMGWMWSVPWVHSGSQFEKNALRAIESILYVWNT